MLLLMISAFGANEDFRGCRCRDGTKRHGRRIRRGMPTTLSRLLNPFAVRGGCVIMIGDAPSPGWRCPPGCESGADPRAARWNAEHLASVPPTPPDVDRWLGLALPSDVGDLVYRTPDRLVYVTDTAPVTGEDRIERWLSSEGFTKTTGLLVREDLGIRLTTEVHDKTVVTLQVQP